MKKGEIYEGIIEKVDFPNKGYVQVDDQKVLIKNGIPGQNVRFMIQKKRSGRAPMVTASPIRVICGVPARRFLRYAARMLFLSASL